MAQSITNTVKSTNPLAGLLGLNPTPLVASGMNSSTAQTLAPKPAAPATNLSNIAGKVGGAISAATNVIPNIVGNEYKAVGNGISGLYNYATAPSGTSYSQANPTQPFQYSPLIPSSQPTSFSSPNQSIVPTGQQTASAAQSQIQQAPVAQNAAATVNTAPVNTATGVNPNAGQFGTGAASGSNSTQPVTIKGLFPDILSSLAGLKSNYDALGTKAADTAASYGQQIADVGGQGARFAAGQKTTGTTPVAEGNAAVTAQTTAAQQQALAQGGNLALSGIQQQIAANQASASALTSAGGLAQPSTASYGQTVFDPVTGQYSGGSSGLPADVMQQYAQMAVSGQYSAIPSFITSNPVLNAQLNVAAKGLNPNFTPVGASGASSVLQSIPALQSANTAAEGIKNTINTYIQSNPQLNPSDLAAGNLLQQWIQGKQLTDPKYQTLFNYLNEYTNTLAPILGVGGDATNLKTQIAQGMVNAAASGQSISQVLNAMSTLASNKIQDLQNGATGGSTTVPNTSTSGSTGGLFNW